MPIKSRRYGMIIEGMNFILRVSVNASYLHVKQKKPQAKTNIEIVTKAP